MGMIAALIAAQMLVFGAVRLVKPRSYEPFTWYPYGGRVLFAIFCVGLGVGALANWMGIPLRFVPPAVAVVCAAVVMHPRMRHRPAAPVSRLMR
ncbi:hypothetical protein ACNAW0_25410 [Micromonospora sp. SL1-18]|uniref:hypothetical protein n=1 Tax=Micromonospora sp. SL1-18 TaxID=3399128 RepID=UPI003A4D42EC